jgi:hypothetical protein
MDMHRDIPQLLHGRAELIEISVGRVLKIDVVDDPAFGEALLRGGLDTMPAGDALDLASLQHAAKPLPPQRARNRAQFGDEPCPELLNENNDSSLAGRTGFELS